MLKYGILAAVMAAAIGLAGCERNDLNGSNGDNIVVNEMGPNNQHMIFWDIESDNVDRVNAYLDAGVDINIRGFMGMTPAIWAATSDSWEMVLLLAERGADLSIQARDGDSVAEAAQRAMDLNRVQMDSPNGRAFLEVQRILREQELL